MWIRSRMAESSPRSQKILRFLVPERTTRYFNIHFKTALHFAFACSWTRRSIVYQANVHTVSLLGFKRISFACDDEFPHGEVGSERMPHWWRIFRQLEPQRENAFVYGEMDFICILLKYIVWKVLATIFIVTTEHFCYRNADYKLAVLRLRLDFISFLLSLSNAITIAMRFF